MSNLMFWAMVINLLRFQDVWQAAQQAPSGQIPNIDVQTARVSFIQNLLGFLPWGDLSVRYTNAFTPPTNFPVSIQPDRYYSHVFTLRTVLFSPLWIDGVIQSRSQLVRAVWQRQETYYRLLVDVAQAYAQAWRAQEVLRLRTLQVERAQRALIEAQAKSKLGAASRLDVLNARYTLLQARTQREQASRDMTSAKAQLATLMGRDTLRDTLAPPPDTLFPLLDAASYPSVIGMSRYASYERLRAVVGMLALLPEVTFEWSWSRSLFERPSWNTLTENQRAVQGWTVSLNFALDRYLFGITQRFLSKNRAQQEARQAYLQAVQTRRDLEVEAQFLKVQREEIQEALAVAREAEELARQRYALGAISMTEWLDAQVRLAQAEETWIQWKAQWFVHQIRKMWTGVTP